MSDEFVFCDDVAVEINVNVLPPWIVLIVDDEPTIHESTRMAMSSLEFDGRQLQFINCYSGAEARVVLNERSDIAVILLDVVMESELAGLDLVRYIRETLCNRLVRIVLRTGQPGQAPEEHVIKTYDINDYRAKTELTRSKLFTVFYASLRSYRDLMRLEQARQGLARAINAINEVYDSRNLHSFASAVLEQVNYLLNIQGEGLCASRTTAYAASADGNHLRVLAATKSYSRLHVDAESSELPADVRDAFDRAFTEKSGHFDKHSFVGYYHTKHGTESVLYMSFQESISEQARELLQVLSANVAITYESLLLREEVEETQRSTIFLLGEAVERRSKETGAHVRRVGEISAVLAAALGLSERDVEDIKQAAPLHDVGKVAIPDRVLNKPAKLDAEEWEIMQTHARQGYEILGKSDKRVLQLSAIIALQHHEKWDGSGYPQALSGVDIHIAGRIVGMADVFDALVSNRCYKSKWTLDEAFAHVAEQSGKHFDPTLAKLLLLQRPQIDEIYLHYPDR